MMNAYFTAIVLLGIAALVAIWGVVRGRAVTVRYLGDVEGKTFPVDLVAFQNLTDPAEERFLRQSLPARDFRQVQRQRRLAAAEYLRWTAHNAAIVLRIGEAARQSTNATVAAAADDLVNTAIVTRVYVSLALCRVYTGLIFPGWTLSFSSVVSTYERLRGVVDRLSQIDQPALSGRLRACL